MFLNSVFAFQPFSRISVPIGYNLSFYSSTGRPRYKSSPDSIQVLLRILAESLYTSPQMQRPIIGSNALRYNSYTYPLLYGTNVITIYYFPNKISKKI